MESAAEVTDESFRTEVRTWLADHLSGEFADFRGMGGPGREDMDVEQRLRWNQHLAEHGWTGVGWPADHGGRGLSLAQQVIFHEEYARSNAPARVNHLGEELLGPTLIAFGTEAQQKRFLPKILAVEELWCQGYSEPGAGSDLANVATRARLDGDEWVIDGQKIWTSAAQFAQWCFVVARTSADLVVGEVGGGWRVAMGLLGFERGVSTLGQQVGFERELGELIALAKENGSFDDPVIRDRLAQAKVELEVMWVNAVRGLSSVVAGSDSSAGGGAASIAKLVWANWHKRLGELAMAILGADGLTVRDASYELDRWQSLYLFSRADTIYGGSDEIQRNILAERVLGLPREPKGPA